MPLLDKLLEKNDYDGILRYLLSQKNHLQGITSTHKEDMLTFPRVTLLVLPLFKALDDSKKNRSSE